MKKEEIRFIYNSKNKRDKEAYGLVRSLQNYIINELDLSKTNITPTQLATIANHLHMPISNLFDENHDSFQESYLEMEENDQLTTLTTNQELIKTPILVNNQDGWFMKSPFDLHPVDLDIDGLKENENK